MTIEQVQQKSALNIVLGTGTFGRPEVEGSRVTNLKDIEVIMDVFQQHGHYEIDTAYIYNGGTSEEYLGRIDWQSRGLVMGTKLYLTAASKLQLSKDRISHSAEDIRKFFDIQLKRLNTDKVDLWYLHGPDRSIPYEETLRAVNDLYEEGKFERFGISNYMSWEVAEIVTICRQNGWIQPTVYQGIYNAVHRTVEPELFPCLRKVGLSFYAFNPLGGGFFTGKYSSLTSRAEAGSRFDLKKAQGQIYRSRYWNEPYFKALDTVRATIDPLNLSMGEVALRWLVHHSLLKREYGDAILIGASNVAHIEQNLGDLEKGRLPEEVVKVLDEAWEMVKPIASKYYH